MSHYFLTVTLTVATPLSLIGMERNVPKLDLTQTNPSNQPRRQPLTPRPAQAAQHLSTKELLKYPAFQAYYFNEAINSGAFTVVSSMIDNENILNGYELAITIRNAKNGQIKPNSPFYSQQIWENWDNKRGPIGKENFKAATLEALNKTQTKSLGHAHRVSIVYKHISNLE